MPDAPYEEEPEHKHQDDHIFGKTAAREQEKVERRLDEADGDPSEIDDDMGERRSEPHAGGRAERP